METENGRPPDPDHLPVAHITVNQVIALNIAYWRKIAGINQEELGRRLGGRTKRNISADERSWDGSRTREFDGQELADLSAALGVPIAAFFMPPDDDGVTVRYEIPSRDPDKPGPHGMKDLTGRMLLDSDDQADIMAIYRGRLRAVVRKYKPPSWHEDVDYWTSDPDDEEVREEKLAIIGGHEAASIAVLGFLNQIREAVERKGRP